MIRSLSLFQRCGKAGFVRVFVENIYSFSQKTDEQVCNKRLKVLQSHSFESNFGINYSIKSWPIEKYPKKLFSYYSHLVHQLDFNQWIIIWYSKDITQWSKLDDAYRRRNSKIVKLADTYFKEPSWRTYIRKFQVLFFSVSNNE